jgi:hypothetical protein
VNKTSQAAFQRHLERALALPDDELAAELRLLALGPPSTEVAPTKRMALAMAAAERISPLRTEPGR